MNECFENFTKTNSLVFWSYTSYKCKNYRLIGSLAWCFRSVLIWLVAGFLVFWTSGFLDFRSFDSAAFNLHSLDLPFLALFAKKGMSFSIEIGVFATVTVFLGKHWFFDHNFVHCLLCINLGWINLSGIGLKFHCSSDLAQFFLLTLLHFASSKLLLRCQQNQTRNTKVSNHRKIRRIRLLWPHFTDSLHKRCWSINPLYNLKIFCWK